MTDSEPLIRFEGVRKRFGDKVVYDALDLEVYSGETLTIIGGSGVGKSVLLKFLLGLLRPDEGRIFAFGDEISSYNERQWIALRRRIAMLFQGGALFDSMTVLQNVAYPLREHGWRDEGAIKEQVSRVLGMVGLEGVEALQPAELSGGMQKRVALARAIAIEPEVILYDEPTTGLDPINIRRINGLIRHLQSTLGVTSVVVTHDMDSALTVADRFAMVHEAQIGFEGTREETERSELPFVKEFIVGGRGTLEPDSSVRVKTPSG